MSEEEYSNDFILFCESNDIYSEYEKDVAWLSWNHQQEKIDAVLHYLSCTNDQSDIYIEEIKEILK